MLVTPINRKFGKHQPGDVFELRDKTANLLIKVGKVAEAKPSQGYMTRDMIASRHEQIRQATPPEFLQSVAEEIEDKFFEEVVTKAEADTAEEAPWGYKADGTPRKRPGRAPSTD